MSGVPAPPSVREKIAHPAASSLDLATIMRTVGDPLRLDIVRLLADVAERDDRADERVDRRVHEPVVAGLDLDDACLREPAVTVRVMSAGRVRTWRSAA